MPGLNPVTFTYGYRCSFQESAYTDDFKIINLYDTKGEFVILYPVGKLDDARKIAVDLLAKLFNKDRNTVATDEEKSDE